jgi:hypothetical protein
MIFLHRAARFWFIPADYPGARGADSQNPLIAIESARQLARRKSTDRHAGIKSA